MKKLVLVSVVLLFTFSTNFAESKNAKLVIDDFLCNVFDNYYNSSGKVYLTVTRLAQPGESCGQSNNIWPRMK